MLESECFMGLRTVLRAVWNFELSPAAGFGHLPSSALKPLSAVAEKAAGNGISGGKS
jgi:hypothetical protein